MAPPLLQVRGLCVSYRTRAGDLPVLRRVSFTLGAGESLGLVGESGCGKSTLALALLRHVARGGRVVSGQVLFRGRDIAEMSEGELRAMRGGGIGMIYQDAMSALNPALRLGVQLAEAGRFHRGQTWESAAAAAEAMLRRVRLPDPERILRAYPHQLSGGQQQRAVIAMALLAQPDVLVLDEPTTALDATVEAGIVALLAELQAETGMAMLFVSHSLGLVSQVCARVAVMYAGEVVELGPVSPVFRAPAHPYTRGLLGCVPRLDAPASDTPALDMPALAPIRGTVPPLDALPPGCAFGPRCGSFLPGLCDAGPVPMQRVGLEAAGGDGHDGDQDLGPNDGLDTGQRQARCVRLGELAPEVAAPLPPRRAAKAGMALVAQGIEKHFALDRRGLAGMLLRRPWDRVQANRGLTLSAPRGRTVAIVGESGCGKSTFARIVAGLDSASAGTLLVDGVDLAQRPVAHRTAAQLRALQMVFQNPDETLNPSYSVGRQLGRVLRTLGGLRGRRAVRSRVAELLALTRLPAGIERRLPHELSGGQKQRVAIARAFAGDPALLVADEPVSALDVSVRAAVTTLLMDLQARRGTTILLISHDLGLVRAMADEVAVMYLGQVVEAGPVAEVFGTPRHPYTAALLAAVPRLDGVRGAIPSGEVPSALSPPAGCPFHPRCGSSMGGVCATVRPAEVGLSAAGHRAACHLLTGAPANARALEPVEGL